ncbi:MAG: Smr/MutS family protein [Candidatus Polarisedimenticolia bacterium]
MTIDGVLDLHTFHPSDVKTLIPDYIEECLARGIFDLRIIHGKGTGALRRSVKAILERHPAVEWVRTADETAGGWGATLVRLRRPQGSGVTS